MNYSITQLLALLLSLLVCVYAVFYADYLSALLPSQPAALTIQEQTQLLQTLSHRSKQALERQKKALDGGEYAVPKLAFCCSADLDVSVRAVDLMNAIHKQTNKADTALDAKHFERIGDLEQLQQSFSYYFSQGAAAEQSMSSLFEFQDVVRTAQSLSNVKKQVGGNAATMALRAALEGNQVLLGAAMGPQMKELLQDNNVQVVGEMGESELVKKEEELEDIHLVLEYSRGDVFRGYTSPRANRYYLNHDIHNARLSVLEQFVSALEAFQPELVVIGGLQLMEVETDMDRRLGRLQKLSQALQKLQTEKVPSHYELAAVSDFSLFDDTVKMVLPYISSLGLNEQELFILHHYLLTQAQPTATTSRPTVAQVSEQLHDVLTFASESHQKEVDGESHQPLAHLSRLHFHTLQFHIMCQKPSSIWDDPRDALIQSALMSSKLACGKVAQENISGVGKAHRSDEIEVDGDRVEVLLDRHVVVQGTSRSINPLDPVMEWDEGDFKCYMIPMLACRKPDLTAGLGDNISGTGLSYHRMKKE